MADIGGSSNDAFYGDGIGHAQANGRDNSAGSITLNDDAGGGDQGLAATSARWNAAAAGGYEPHSILAGLPGMSGNGTSAEDAQRKLPGGGSLPSPNGSG